MAILQRRPTTTPKVGKITALPSTLTRVDSQWAQFRKRIPRELRARLIGKSFPVKIDDGEVVTVRVTASSQCIVFSLRTTDLKVALRRKAKADEAVAAIFEQCRQQTFFDLSHKQIVALSGIFYSGVAVGPDTKIEAGLIPPDLLDVLGPKPIVDYFAEAERLDALSTALPGLAINGGEAYLQRTYGAVATWLLMAHNVDGASPISRWALIQALSRTLPEALKVRARYARGDYSEDQNLKRYPEWQGPTELAASFAEISLVGLVDVWWRELSIAGVTHGTYEGYSNTFRRLADFVGHDDALSVRPENVAAFKDFRLHSTNSVTGKPISAKTVKGSDLAALKSVFKWAVNNQLLPSNPAERITVKLGKRPMLREREFTSVEAKALLGACLAITQPTSQTELAKRWVPWLCAYSGCRLGEAIQLRKEDIRFDAETASWFMRITPEAGTVKTKEYRDVPLHRHLIELGFIEQCVHSPLADKTPYLFMTIGPKTTLKGVWRSKKNRLEEFARSIVTDPNVAPNHGWRHTFKAVGFEAGIQEKVLDAICGHAPASVGRQYGSVTLRTKVEAMKLFPTWEA